MSVALFDDRLEIWSTGTLPGGLTPEKLKGIHESIPRNRLVAEVFYRRGLIERWGRGTNKILAEAKKIGCPEPEFEETAGAFVVRFRPAVEVERPEAPAAELTERQSRALEFIVNRGPCRLADIVASFGGKVSERTVQRDLEGLRRQGLVRLEGVGRGARYRAVRGHPE